MASDPVRAAHEANRRQLCAELQEPALSWGEAIERVGELARADRQSRIRRAQDQCRATSRSGDRCSRDAGHDGCHHCDDPSFSWSM